MNQKMHTCPCGSGNAYADCCEPCHSGSRPAATAEGLMRTRYSAYVLENGDYLLKTWHQSTRPLSLELHKEPDTKWIGLKIIQVQMAGHADTEGSVEFVARYKINGRAHKLHEVSRFVNEKGQWYYLGGDILT